MENVWPGPAARPVNYDLMENVKRRILQKPRLVARKHVIPFKIDIKAKPSLPPLNVQPPRPRCKWMVGKRCCLPWVGRLNSKCNTEEALVEMTGNQWSFIDMTSSLAEEKALLRVPFTDELELFMKEMRERQAERAGSTPTTNASQTTAPRQTQRVNPFRKDGSSTNDVCVYLFLCSERRLNVYCIIGSRNDPIIHPTDY